MRSGASAATRSKSTVCDTGSTVGSGAPPSFSAAHGNRAPGWSPYHSEVPTGTVPSAMTASWSV